MIDNIIISQCQKAEYLNEHYQVQSIDVHSDHDLLHKIGIVDKHIRKDPKFTWLCDITSQISRVFKEFNYGKNYEKLIEACESLNISLKDPIFFSETRFPNSCYNVYNSFLTDIPAILKCLMETAKLINSNNGKERDLAKLAEDVLKKVQNKKFILTLCGIVDIYSMFSLIVSIVQKVNKLPYQRYDEFFSVVNSLEKMKQTLSNHSECKNKCLWPRLHSNIDNIKSGKFQIGKDSILLEKESDLEPQMVTRHNKSVLSKSQNEEDAENSDIKRLCDLLSHVKDDMVINVYNNEEVEMIKVIRRLTDWSALAVRINRLGCVLTQTLEESQYLLDCRKMVRSLRNIPSSIITNQFKIFIQRLHEETKNMTNDQIKKTDSKELIKRFLKTDLYLYKDIEMIMAAAVVGCIKLGLESIAESMISKYNIHSSYIRPISDDSVHNEMVIDCNGPSINEADDVLSEAASYYFSQQKSKNDWNFVTNNNINGRHGTVIKKKFSIHSRFPFTK